MAAQSSSSIAGMSVEFGADFTELDSAPSQVGAVFAEIQAAAEEAATGISDSLTSAADSFSSISQAASDASIGISDSNQAALASYDELASGAGGSLATISEEAAAAATGVTEFGDAGASSGTGILEALAEITQSINALHGTFIDVTNALVSSMDSVATSVKDVQYAVESMSSDVTGSLDNLEVGFTNVSASATASSEAIAEAGSSAENASSGGFMHLFNQIGFGIMNFQNYLNIAKQVATGLLGPAVSAETVTTALTTMDGSAAKAGQEMAALNAFAAKTPFKTLDIDQAAMQLQGFGYQASGVIPMIKAIGDALGSVGKETPAEMLSVVDIFGKMKTEGKVTVMMMNELAVHGINAWKALSDGSGKTIPQLQEMIKKGLLPSKDAVADLTKGIEMNPLYAGGMARAAGTFTGLLSTLQSNWQQVIAAFGTPIIKALEGQLNNLGTLFASPSFQQFAGSVGQGIVNVFQGIGGAVSGVIGYFKSFDLTPITHAFHDLGDAVGKITGPFTALGSNKAVSGFFSGLKNDLSQGIVTAIKDVSGFVEGLASALSGLSKNSAVSGFLSSLQSGFQQVAGIVGGQLHANFQMFLGIAQSLGKWWQSTMWPAIQQAMPGFEHLGSVIATTVVPAMAKIWAVGQQVARDVMPPLIQAFETIAPIVVKVGGFIADNLGQAIQFLTPYIVSAAQAIGQFAGDLISRVVPIIQLVWKAITAGIEAIEPIWNAVWPSLKQVFQGVWEGISGIIKVVWSIVSGVIKVGLDLLSGNWKQAWNDIKDTFSGIWDGIKGIFKGVWDEISGILKGAINVVIGLINSWIKGIDRIGIDAGPIHWHPNIPTIPTLASGGVVPPGGVAIAGDPGPNSELVFGGTTGATVLSHAASAGLMAGGGGGQAPIIHNHIYINGQEMAQSMMVQVLSEIRGGGHPLGEAA